MEMLTDSIIVIETATSKSHDLASAAVDNIIQRLEKVKRQLVQNESPDQLLPLSQFHKTANQKVLGAQKEWSTAVSKFGKEVEKQFATTLDPLFPPAPSKTATNDLNPVLRTINSEPVTRMDLSGPFGSPEAIKALNETISIHLARIGAFDTLETFISETSISALESTLLVSLRELHSIILDLKSGLCTKALDWVLLNSPGNSDLEFELRKEEFIQILLKDSDLSIISEPLLPSTLPSPHAQSALAYGGNHFRSLVTPSRQAIICALLTSPLYMPFSKLIASPYATIYSEYADSKVGNGKLSAAFAAAYLKHVELPKHSPLSVVTDIGGGGALKAIQKAKNVMKDSRTEWSAIEELPVEIPLPPEYRYHSIFACPVSKEQASLVNPPMLLPCGHVIAKESLIRLGRGSPTLKCPYCPIMSQINSAVLVHF